MDFKDSIKQLSQKANQFKDNLQTEEATKTALIMPFIQALDYDVFNPTEVIPEMDCALINKKSDKIDYAIMSDNKPIMLIECKQANTNLELHTTQLQKYYAASNAKFGLLTNGIEYRFYADLDKINIMDDKPFLVVNILDLSDHDIEQLKKFHKSYYDENEILSTAQDLKYSTEIKNILSSEINSPSINLVTLLAKQVYNGKITQKVTDFFSPIVKKSFNDIINDIIQERLNMASAPQQNLQQSELPNEDNEQDETPTSNGIVTTQDELDAYNVVRSILWKHTDPSKIEYKDCKTYFSVFVKNSSHWICRFYFGQSKKQLCFPQDGYSANSKVEIKYIDEIFNYSEHLEKALEIAINSISTE